MYLPRKHVSLFLNRLVSGLFQPISSINTPFSFLPTIIYSSSSLRGKFPIWERNRLPDPLCARLGFPFLDIYSAIGICLRRGMDRGWKSWEGYNRQQKYGRPPQHPGSWHSAVPSWEKRFCTSVCLVPWGRICATKASMSAHINIVDWDDSAALEAFQNAKARYWAEINGLPCDIPIPGSDIYIDKVDHNAVIDPKLVEDLEKEPPPPPDLDIDMSVNWDSFINANKPVPVTGWGDAEDDAAERPSIHSVNWEAFLDKAVRNIQPTGWGDEEPSNGVSNTWEPNKVGSTQTTGWCDAEPTNADPGNMWNQNGGWGDGTIQDCSWGGGRNKTSWGNGREPVWGRSDNWNNEHGRNNGRKRNGGQHGSRFSKSRHQMNNCQINTNNWKGHTERNVADYPYEKTMHAGKPMAVRQWKSKHSCGPMNHDKSAESAGAWSWKKSII